MNNNVVATKVAMPSVFQEWINDPKTKLPAILGQVLTPVLPELGNLTVIHPTDNDPVLVSDKIGVVAIWFDF